jgi:hypothetical protein
MAEKCYNFLIKLKGFGQVKMSETWLHGIPRWGVKECPVLESYQNSHGGAPVVWNFMAQRYLNVPHYYHLDNDDLLWATSRNEKADLAHRKVMTMTYDRAVILREHVDQAVKHIHEFLAEFQYPMNTVNHWAQIAEDLQKHNQKGKYVGFGFCMTTIGETLFQGEEYLKNGKYRRSKIEWKRDKFFPVYTD